MRSETHLLIVDGPGREDPDLLARAKAVRPELKVIVTTEGARALDSDLTNGYALLAKPFTLADLAATVRRALDASAEAALPVSSGPRTRRAAP